MLRSIVLATLLALGGCTFPTAIVTAAVTQEADGRFVLQDTIRDSKVVPVEGGSFHVVITNERNHRSASWSRFTYATARACEDAIEGLNPALRSVANPDPEDVPQTPEHADPQLVEQLISLIASVVQNTGVTPSLSISCEADGI